LDTLPPATEHIWRVFIFCHANRTFGPHVANPIAFSEIEAFLRLTGESLHPWEIELVIRLDGIFRAGNLVLPQVGPAPYKGMMERFKERGKK
jgi:hypothetical protein